MSTYDNLNIAQATLIFDTNGNSSVGAGEFDLSTMAFLPNVPLIDQIEVERVFDTGADTKFGENIFTVADRREMFIFPKNWYTINEQTKILKFIDLNTIPTGSGLVPPVYYPLSRSYKLILQITDDTDPQYGNTLFINIPPVLNTTFEGPPVRQYDKVYIRRKTPSINSIVTFAPGTRLTTTQLNLQFDQLKYIVQELLAKVKNEIILKYDENAIDGPFLGNTDLKMNNNFIKDAGTKQITETLTMFTGLDNIAFSGGSVTPNVLAVNNAVTKGSLYRTGLVASPASFTGDFTTRLPDSATDYKITNLAPGTASTDAVNLSQLNDANNLTTGTVHVNRLPTSIPLAKLSSAVGQIYTLPLENLPSTLGTAIGTFGKSTPGNVDNMVYATVNNKGILSGLGHRNMTVDDLPAISGLVAQAYGGTGKLLTVTPDTKGRITSISSASIVNADLPNSTVSLGTYGSENATNTLVKFTVDSKGIITSASHRSIVVSDLPTTGVTQASTYGKATANNTQNMLQIAYDTTGRVTLASHRNMGHDDLPANIPLSKLSNADNQGYILPKDAIENGSIVVAKLNTTLAGQAPFPVSFIPSGIILSKIDPATPGTFKLPDACLNDTAVVPNAYTASPIKDITVDSKGRITSISQRAIGSGDIPALSASAISITTSAFADALIPAPSPAPTANTYGSASAIPTITVDAKGRITTISTASLAIANVSGVDAAVNSLIDTRALSHAGGAFFNAGTKKISNVVNPEAAQDVVTKNYLEANAIYATGANLSAGTKYLTDLIMRPSGSLSANDAVNFGYIETAIINAGGQQLVGTSSPQVFKQTWASANAITSSTPSAGYIRYQFNFVDPATVLYATSATMMLVEGTGGTRVFTPNLSNATQTGVNAVYDGYFWLDTSGGATKVLNVYVNSTPTGDITIRNFGLSRIVAGGTATTSATGLVSIAPGTEGGISVSGAGAIALIPATASQIGGVKINNTTGGLINTSGLIAVDLSDSVSSASTTTVANSKAVKAAYDKAVDVQTNLTSTNNSLSTTNSNVTTAQNTANAALPKAGGTMTGMIQLAGSTTTLAPLRFVGGSAPTTSLTAGDVWFESNTLKMRIGTTTKDIAFTDSALSGTAATATKLANAYAIQLTGPVTGSVNFDGSAAVSIATTIATDAVALGTNTTGAYVATATGTDGVSVAGSGGESAGITITNTDKGSSQAIFKTITPSSGTSVTAATNASTLTLSGSGNITVTGSGSTITIANTATAPLTFGTIAVTGTAGQTAVAADSSAATLTLNAGTGMSITTNAGSDVITLANTGITSISGTGSQVNVSAGTTPTISLPQNIHSGASPTFAGATLGSVIIAAGAANTLTTGTNLDLILDPNGTGKISLLATVDCSSNALNATGACTLGTVLSDAITMRTTGAKLKFGSAVDTTIEAMSTTSTGVYTVGDIVFRVPAAANKAFLITDPTAVPTAGTQLITKTALDTAVSSAISGGNLMPTTGAVPAAAQTLGCTAGSFNIQTGSPATNRLTIVNGGAATFSGALTVTGGTTLSDTLAVTGTTTLNQEVTVNSAYNVTAGKAPSAANHLTNKTYVDNSINSISDTDANLVLKKLLMQIPIRQFTVAPLVQAKIIVHTTEITNMVVNVPKYFTGWHAANSTRSLSIVVPENYQIIILHFSSTSTDFTNSFNSFLNTVSNLHTLPVNPVSQMLAFRTGDTALSSSGTFTRTAVGTTFTGGPGGSTFTIFSDMGSTGHRSDLILMRIV